MEETEKTKKWVMFQVEEQINRAKQELKFNMYEQETQFLNFKSLFVIPGMIGENQPYSNIQTYLKESYAMNKQKWDNVNGKLYELESIRLGKMGDKVREMGENMDRMRKDTEQLVEQGLLKMEEESLMIKGSIQNIEFKVNELIKELKHKLKREIERSTAIDTQLGQKVEDIER